MKIRIVLLTCTIFIWGNLFPQWNKISGKYENVFNHYEASKRFNKHIQKASNEDLISYARSNFYQGKFNESFDIYKNLIESGFSLKNKDLQAFYSANNIIKKYDVDVFLERYKIFYKEIDFPGFENKIVQLNWMGNQQTNCWNTEDFEEHSPVIYKGDVFFVSSRPSVNSDFGNYNYNNQPFYDIYEVKGCNAVNIKRLNKFPKNLNSEMHDGPFCISQKNNFLIVSKNLYHKTSKSYLMGLVIYYKDSTNKWDDGQEFALNSPGCNTQHPNFDDETNTLYFVSDRPGGSGGMDIYRSMLSDTGWVMPENISAINSPGDDVFPHYAMDALYFASNGYLNKGGLDIYKFSNDKMVSLDFFNSAYDDYGLVFKDSVSGYFSTNKDKGFGKDDILSFDLFNQNPNAGIVNAIRLSDTILFGNPVSAKLRFRCLDASTKELVENPYCQINLLNKESKINSDFKYNTDSFQISVGYLEKDSVFDVVIDLEKVGYQPKKVNYQDIVASGGILDLGNIYLFRSGDFKPKEITNKVGIPNIYFDLDKHLIRKDASITLDSIAGILKKDPDAILEIKTFTDSRASIDYNLKLADRRAKSTMDYLVRKGISRKRLAYGVFGESLLVNDCGDDKKCEERLHQLNRRAEFKLIR